jgi:hypothetical protein
MRKVSASRARWTTFMKGTPLKTFLACLKEVLTPAIVEIADYPFSSAYLCYARLTFKTFKDYPDLLFRGKLAASLTTDISDYGLRILVLSGTHGILLPDMPKLQNHTLTSSYPCPLLENGEQTGREIRSGYVT